MNKEKLVYVYFFVLSSVFFQGFMKAYNVNELTTFIIHIVIIIIPFGLGISLAHNIARDSQPSRTGESE